MGVRCTVTTWPCPPQVEQVEAVVPAFTPLPVQTPHSSSLLTLMSFLQTITRPAQVELSHMLSNVSTTHVELKLEGVSVVYIYQQRKKPSECVSRLF